MGWRIGIQLVFLSPYSVLALQSSMRPHICIGPATLFCRCWNGISEWSSHSLKLNSKFWGQPDTPLLIFPSYHAVFAKASLASGFTESNKTRPWQLWGLGRAQALTSLRGCGWVWQVTIKESLYEEGALRHPSSTSQYVFVSFPNLKLSQAVLIKTSWEMNNWGWSIKKFNLEMEQTIVRIPY